MKYDVHLFATVRVKVIGIEAESQHAAIEMAAKRVDLGQLDRAVVCGADHVEWTDEIDSAVVDEADDTEFTKTQAYRPCPEGGWMREG